tara:strand:+ start:3219 stop:3617 length:399 start_codon:yes stop_codon:yes gene_type:complete
MRKKPQMTKLEIIDELITNGYAKDPSTRGVAIGGLTCAYRNSDTGNRCAVGKCISDQYIGEFSDFQGSVKSLENHLAANNNLNLDDILIEKYRGHEVEFWQSLQVFHDKTYNFNDVGLTENGVKRLEFLRTE